jgi:hypothetical protein
VTGAEQQTDPVGEQASGDEGQGVGRRQIEPVGVVDDHQQRLLPAGVGEQAQ